MIKHQNKTPIYALIFYALGALMVNLAVITFFNSGKVKTAHKTLRKLEVNQQQNLAGIDTTTKTDVIGEYRVEWNLNLGGKDFLLESAFLKAGLERSIKNYINLVLECDSEINDASASFYSVNFAEIEAPNLLKNRGRSGSGLCKGNRTRCKKGLKKTNTDAGKNSSFVVSAAHTRRKNCEDFRSSTIFDAFNETLITASSFNYNVDVKVIQDLKGSLDLNYNVTFIPAKEIGLDQIQQIGLDAMEPEEISTECTHSQCMTQRSVILDIFRHFNIDFDERKHECLYAGINCNEAKMVTQIWIVNENLNGYTIPDLFESLPTLNGLFLGGNQLTGTIPPSIARLSKLKMLWLQDNALTGSIPSEFGNIRALFELNLHGNQLTGTIPSEVAKLKKLRLLNLGRNNLHGMIPKFIEETKNTDGLPNTDCVSFLDPFEKIYLSLTKRISVASDEPLLFLKTLALYENHLSGTIPPELYKLEGLVDLNLADNMLTGELPKKLGELKNLKVLDIRGNLLSGSIPPEIGSCFRLEKLNFYNNRLEKLIPTDFGRLSKLTELVLDKNLLSGPIPPTLGNLRDLRYLSFSGNKMFGDIPTSLGNLVSLENLDIRDYVVTNIDESSGKKMKGTIPSELGKLTAWKFVVFQNNELQGTIPSEFGDLQTTEILWLKNQKLSGQIPTDLARLESLSHVSLGNNSLEGPILPLEKLSKLENLDLGKNNLRGTIPSELRMISSLKTINFGENGLTGELPTELGLLNELTQLIFCSNKLSGALPTEFGLMPKLENMSLCNNNLTGPIPSEIGFITTLGEISLENNRLSGQIPSEIGQLESLETLDIGENEFEGQLPTQLGDLKSLEILDVGGNDFTGTIPSELGIIEALVSLDIGENMFTGTIPSEIQDMPGLESLDIGGTNIIGDLWFMCDLKSFEIDESMSLDCFDYCGTVDEECKADDIGDAKCKDVDCNGIGIPSCTSRCKLDYSSCIPGGDEITFRLELETDNNGWRTEWEISDESGPVHESNSPYRNSASILEFYCLRESCYTFELSYGEQDDSGHDDNDGEKQARYSLQIDGVMTGGSNLNDSQLILHTFGTCSNDPHPVVTPSPTESPSSQPSRSPVAQINPSSQPSVFLTEIPPSRPSSYPSMQPTLYPTRSPSLSPTMYPSESPTSSSLPTLHPTETQSPSAFFSFTEVSPPDNGVSDFFGQSVSVDGTLIVIGAERDDDMGNDSGSAYVYDLSDNKIVKLVAPDGAVNDRFGQSVAISGTTIVVGADGDDVGGIDNGSAYVFNTAGTLLAQISANDGMSSDRFGHSVDISGTFIVVGAWGDDDNGSFSGSAYIFNTFGGFEKKLLPPNGKANDRFGLSVSIGGGIIVVGAEGDDDGGTDSGSAYVFDLSGGLLTKLVAPDPSTNDGFGHSVSTDGTTIVVGAWKDSDQGPESGSAYVFAAFTFSVKLVAPDGKENAWFGNSVSVDGTNILIGSARDDENGFDSGAAYIFNVSGNFIAKLELDGVVGNMFGFSVGVSGTNYIVGSLDSGSVYIYN